MLRQKAELESPLCAKAVVREGTALIVLEERTLPDGTRRALVAHQGQHRSAGWVSWTMNDGSPGLVSRATAFKQRMSTTAEDTAAAAERRAAQRLKQRRSIRTGSNGQPAASAVTAC